MITRKEAEARIATGGTLTREELSQVLLSPKSMTAGEMEWFSQSCPEWVAEQEAREAETQAKEARYLAEETPLREELHALGYPVKWVVETEVFKKTPFGARYIDIEVTHNGKLLGGIETKLGDSRYTASQRAKDTWLKIWEKYPVQVVREPR